MILKNVLICISVLIVLTLAVPNHMIRNSMVLPTNKTFTIDWTNKTFLKDGKPFRFISGSFHYFRAHPESWQRKLRIMRAAGLNAVTTLIDWSLHNPKENVYKWDGIANLERFIEIAESEDLLVILRPGPYISGERDLGGIPFWLLKKYPNIKLRTSDQDYINENKIWYVELWKRLEPYLYGNGGPIILIQLENNYKAFVTCDSIYFNWLKEHTESYVKNKAVLYSYPGAGCGLNSTILTTDSSDGPYVRMEYFVGWYTNWKESMARQKLVTKYLIDLLNIGASVNFFMFYGGTNFGFTAGARTDSNGNNYKVAITSYDYDGAMNEAGDPTEKYFRLREIIGNYLPLPNIAISTPKPKKNYGILKLIPQFSILSERGRKISTGKILSENPLSFEDIDQYAGLVLYETNLPLLKKDTVQLKVDKIHDRGYVYVDNQFVGILSRSNSNHEITILSDFGSTIQIVVENQGRALYENVPLDYKGILGDVYYDEQKLTNWTMIKYPFDDCDKILHVMKEQKIKDEIEQCDRKELSNINKKICQSNSVVNFNDKYDLSNLFENVYYHGKILKNVSISFDISANIDSNNEEQNIIGRQQSQLIKENLLRNGPVVFYGELKIDKNDVTDTYIDTTGWSKGFIFVNGFNLGRYWPVVGPQITLHVPREVLKEGVNEIILVEYQSVSSPKIVFTDTPKLDG